VISVVSICQISDELVEFVSSVDEIRIVPGFAGTARACQSGWQASGTTKAAC
jgi:hypothetical protein